MTTIEKNRRLLAIKKEMNHVYDELKFGTVLLAEYQSVKDDLEDRVAYLIEQQEKHLEDLKRLAEETILIQEM